MRSLRSQNHPPPPSPSWLCLTFQPQYYSFVLFDDVVRNEARLKEALQRFFDERVCPALMHHRHYVVDVSVNLDSMQCVVIEINPFHNGAGAGLFSWRDHRELFMHGPPSGVGFELRLARELTPDPYHVLPTRWTEYIRAHRAQRETKCILM